MSKYLKRDEASEAQQQSNEAETNEALAAENLLLRRLLEEYVLKAAVLQTELSELRKALDVRLAE